jgi:soluble lytic murein transglycosylase
VNVSRRILLPIILAAVAVAASPSASPQAATGADVVLLPTNHPRVPASINDLWLAPDAVAATRNEFGQAVKLEVDNNFAHALPIFSKPSLQQGLLGYYGQYYKGLAELRLGRAADARATFRALQGRGPAGYLIEAAAMREAECDEALGDQATALAVYEGLSRIKTSAPDDVLMRVGRAARALGDEERAAAAFSRVYFEYPLGDFAAEAGSALDQASTYGSLVSGGNRYKLELGRAERLFAAKHYPDARAAFEALRTSGRAVGDDHDLVVLRLAESDYFLKRARNAHDAVRPFLDKPARRPEALFFYAASTRQLGSDGEYLRLIRQVVDEFPTSSWAEEALNDLGSYYIVKNDDDKADATFREQYEKFPSGRYAERAAWKIGWRSYRAGQYADMIRVFERAAADFPRSDYRPSWLYWTGRAYAALGNRALADARYTLAATDYLNSYYGRLALQQLNGRAPARPLVVETASVTPGLPTADLIRALLAMGLYDQGIDEIHFAQNAWGDSSLLEATLAWIYQRQGLAETGERRFTLYRSAINTMKRAYPQYLAAGGEGLPPDLLRVIFPLSYWDLIRKHAAEHNIDPFLLAALVAQESTFVPDIRSYAKAVGLMQLMPATARRTAKTLKVTYTPKLLTNPEANIHLGAAYFAEKIKEFNGDLYLALASYNAGETPVHRWVTERPGVPVDEFIDDIPYPQTQLYVKKILGTADDYRRLYGAQGTLATR